jgi:CrcB protein
VNPAPPGDRGPSVDPDVDLHDPAQRRELSRTHGAIVAVIALGGGLGALARYGLALAWPTLPGGFPWATFLTNVSGCFLIGMLMVAVTEVWTAHPLLRPFLGTGVLGGFTTFSTYAVEVRRLLQPGTVGVAFGYLAATLLCAFASVMAATILTRALLARVQRLGARS